MTGRSGAFASFENSYFGDPYMAWHDGLDTQSLLSLQGEEREEAERMLLEALSKDSSDPRPAAGLAALRSTKATDRMKQLLRTSTGDQVIEAARGLWAMEKYPPAADALIDILLHYPFWGTQLDAAIALREVKTPASVAALQKALNDPESLVRHHAASSLLIMYGLQDESSYEDNPLTIDIMSDEQGKRTKARATIRKLIKEKGKIEMETV